MTYALKLEHDGLATFFSFNLSRKLSGILECVLPSVKLILQDTDVFSRSLQRKT